MQTVQYKRKVVDAKHILLFMTDILLTSITINTRLYSHIYTQKVHTHFDNIHLRQMFFSFLFRKNSKNILSHIHALLKLQLKS